MYFRLLDIKGTWTEVSNAARTTVSREETEFAPSKAWRKQILLAEHSPIRKLVFSGKWRELKSWVSVHLTRHKYGVEHFVRTQRSDRTGITRDKLPQGAEVEHEIEANAQAIISISRKRLCSQASPETREAWKAFLHELHLADPILATVCVPECIYRGFCPEFKSCGFDKTEQYQRALTDYRS